MSSFIYAKCTYIIVMITCTLNSKKGNNILFFSHIIIKLSKKAIIGKQEQSTQIKHNLLTKNENKNKT